MVDVGELLAGAGQGWNEMYMTGTDAAAGIKIPAGSHGQIVDGVEQFSCDVVVPGRGIGGAAEIDRRRAVPVVAGLEFDAQREHGQFESKCTGEDDAVMIADLAIGEGRVQTIKIDVVLVIPAGAKPHVKAGARASRCGGSNEKRSRESD